MGRFEHAAQHFEHLSRCLHGHCSAREILDERYARGKREEYEQMRRDIQVE